MSHADQTGSMSLDDGGAAGLGHDAALVLLWAENLAALPRGVALEPGTTVIGREPVGRGFRVVAPAVSRSHAAIEVGPRGCFIKDLGSRNGTRVGGVAIQHHALAHGDVVRIGDAVFVFVAHDGRRHLELDRADPARARGSSRVEGLVGGLSMDRLSQDVAGAIASGHAVLIQGETGVGKEIVARAIHEGSRRPGAFVAVNCPAIPSTLFESELFGHVRGAFTGADKDRAGRLASARGGTLFLDEVAEIPLETQAKLLRAVQFGEVQRLGTDRPEVVDVRIVAATHRNLAERVAQGTFRQDLYYRLRVVELSIPPLRERQGDVALLAHHYVSQFASKRSARLSPVALRKLEAHDWPGNVRELAHAIERACILSTGDEISADQLPEEIRRINAVASTPTSALPETHKVSRFSRFDKDELEQVSAAAVREVEREFVEGLLAATGGNVSRAASESGLHRSQLQRMMARLRG